MPGAAAPPSASPVPGAGLTPLAVAVEELRAAAEDMEEAAWREGIDPAGPLGVFVRAMRKALLVVADLAAGQAVGVGTTVRDARALTQGELEKLRTANQMSANVLEQARVALAGSEVQRERVIGRFVETVAPQVVEAIREAVVIRERRYNQRVHWGRAAGIAALAAGVLLGGYIWGSQGSGDAVAAGAVALDRIRQCQAAPVKDGRTGEAYCPLKGLLPPA